ncbi:MAG: Asp-tRNA(Asn)/Glu-tRNA(Gln) amidotransferase subunit GatC [Gammaproteobacteria bacterium]
MDTEEITKIAHLARLGVDAKEHTAYAENLTRILDFVEQLNAVDTTGVTPLAHPFNESQRLRPDEVTETNQRDSFQQVAPEIEAGLYLVPKVIE